MTTWWNHYESQAPGSTLATDAVTSLLKQEVSDMSDSTTKLSGTFTGGTLNVDLETDAAVQAVEYAILLLPPGISDPTTWPQSTKKAYEEYVWYTGFLDHDPNDDTAFQLRLRIDTSRKIVRGTFFECLLINRGLVSWAATWRAVMMADLYLHEG